MFPQTLSPRNTNYWVIGVLFCFPISDSIVSLNLEMFYLLVTVKMCWLKECCLQSWTLVPPRALSLLSASQPQVNQAIFKIF